MVFFKQSDTAVIIILSALTLLVAGKLSFTLHQIESRSSIKSGPAVGLSTYHKFNKRAPKTVESAAAINHGTVIASLSRHDGEYLTPITIGGQTLDVMIDTGSDFL